MPGVSTWWNDDCLTIPPTGAADRQTIVGIEAFNGLAQSSCAHPGYHGRDPATDADIAALETELGPECQKRISADMQRIYADQLPALPLFFPAEAAVLPIWLHGYTLTRHSGYSSR